MNGRSLRLGDTAKAVRVSTLHTKNSKLGKEEREGRVPSSRYGVFADMDMTLHVKGVTLF